MPQLDPGEAVAFVNGQVESAQLNTNKSSDGYELTGDGFGMNFASANTDGKPIKLDNDGNLVLNGDRIVVFGGYGFAPGSPVKVWMFSDPVSLREVVADENGEFIGQSTIPRNIPFGQHTVQLNGISNEGVVRTLSMGVKLVEPKASAAEAKAPSESISFNWIYALALVPFGFLFWIILARKRRQRKSS